MLVASLGFIGADSLWLVAAGRNIGSSTLSFATAPTANWHNAPVLGELVFRALYAVLQERGLELANVCAAAIGFGALAVGLRRQGATAGGSTLASLLVVVGSVPTLAIVRNGLFTLAFFPLLLLLLEDDSRRPSRRILLAVPLICLWGNCHGGVLVGFALLAVYVLVARRDAVAFATLGGSLLALFATPQLWHTADYYAGVMQNEAARMGVAQWAPLFSSSWDIPLVASALVLVAVGVRSYRAWEAVAVLGLAAATIHTARLGTWLLFVAAYPAARALRVARLQRMPVAVPVLIGALALVGLLRTPVDFGDRALAKRAARSGQAVLADAVPAEQVEVAGGKVWVANPIDAFRKSDQRLYLDWILGRPSGSGAVTRAQLVLVRHDSAAARVAAADPRLVPIARNENGVLYRVRP